LNARGLGVRVVYVVSPRRLFRARDVAWAECREPDPGFLDDQKFDALFGGDALVAVTATSSALLEPLLLRSRAPRDMIAWQRGDTTSGQGELGAINGLTGDAIARRALELIDAR
jgi:phosphoketolase